MFEEQTDTNQSVEEDVILPDDYQAEESVEDTAPAEESQEQQEQPEEVETNETEGMTEEQKEAFLKIKYNKEEMELDEERARELAQKGLNYDKVQERLQSLENDPRISFVDQLAQESGYGSFEEFQQAFQQQQEQEQINALVQKNIPEEYAKEMLENRKFRQEYESKQQAEQEKAQQDQELSKFIEAFPNVKPDDIPVEVWEKVENGESLKESYLEHQYKQLQSQLKTLKQNKENEKKAPVQGVTQHGSQEVASEDDFMKGFNSI